MHGAIVADAMRVPWIALRPLASVHRLKWHDWAGALEVDVRFQALAASSLPERLNVLGAGRVPRRGVGRLWQSAAPAPAGWWPSVASPNRPPPSLDGAAKAEPQLSARPCVGSLSLPHAGAAGGAATHIHCGRFDRAFAASALHLQRKSAYQEAIA